MAINIVDHDAAYHRLGDALEDIDIARAILRDTDTPIAVDVRNSVLAAMTKTRSARYIISNAIKKQERESNP